jgi:hypothetical protein
MTTSQTTDALSRRTALAGLGAAGLGLALAATTLHTAAQDASTEMATHPMVGVWMAGRAPNDLGIAHIGPDGVFTNSGPIVAKDANGALTYSDPAVGAWEPISERGIHFTFTTRNYDATGALTGYFTVDGYPVASEDGESFWDDGKLEKVTIRDPNGVVVQVLGGDGTLPPIGGVRSEPGKPGYDEMLAMLAAQPAATPEAGTPTP